MPVVRRWSGQRGGSIAAPQETRIVALVVALVTVGLVHAQSHEPITSVISGAVAFGATLSLVWTIISNFGRRGR